MTISVIELPFNRHVGLQTCSTDDGLLDLPAGGQFLNHIGTVHAGAQLTLAEACSGEFLVRSFPPRTDVMPVVRRVEAKFRKPANGRLTASVSTPLARVQSALDELAERGRCLFTIDVDVRDEHGVHSLSASFEWFVTKL